MKVYSEHLPLTWQSWKFSPLCGTWGLDDPWYRHSSESLCTSWSHQLISQTWGKTDGQHTNFLDLFDKENLVFFLYIHVVVIQNVPTQPMEKKTKQHLTCSNTSDSSWETHVSLPLKIQVYLRAYASSVKINIHFLGHDNVFNTRRMRKQCRLFKDENKSLHITH